LENNLKIKIPLVTKPILKKKSTFVGGNPNCPKKITTNKDAYKRQ
jgi:hypothetical protein